MKDYLPYFKATELQCKCGNCDGGDMQDNFMQTILWMRIACDFPFVINSAFRCESHNKKVGGAKNSLHTQGRAIDIACNSEQCFEIVYFISRYQAAKIGGIGISQKGKKRFIHLDDGLNRIWTY